MPALERVSGVLQVVPPSVENVACTRTLPASKRSHMAMTRLPSLEIRTCGREAD